MSVVNRRLFLNSLAAAGLAVSSPAQSIGGSESALSENLAPGSATQSEGSHFSSSSEAVFNVKAYGATGRKSDDATTAIQKAIDACAGGGGGTVYLPPMTPTLTRSSTSSLLIRRMLHPPPPCFKGMTLKTFRSKAGELWTARRNISGSLIRPSILSTIRP